MRTRGAPEELVPTLRGLLREQDVALVPEALETMQDLLRGSLAQPRLYWVPLTAFAVCALARPAPEGVRCSIGVRLSVCVPWIQTLGRGPAGDDGLGSWVWPSRCAWPGCWST